MRSLNHYRQAEIYRRSGITMEKLDDIAHEMSDNEFAERMVRARSNVFQNISRWIKPVGMGYPLIPSPESHPKEKNDH